MTGAGTAFTFIPVSIGALAGVAERDARVASRLLNTSQQLGGAIGVAVASTVAATASCCTYPNLPILVQEASDVQRFCGVPGSASSRA